MESFCDLLGVSAKKANDYLRAANLMKPHNQHKTLCPVINNWKSLIGEYGLDMEVESASQKDFLGIKVYSIRIGCLGNNNKKTTFTARQQAIRFFDGEKPKQNDGFKKGWEPSRLRATRQCNDFLCNTAFALTIFLAEEQKELEEKEKEEKEKEEANRADRHQGR